MPSRKCAQCGIVNFDDSVACRRCTVTLDPATAAPAQGSWRHPTAVQQAVAIVIFTLVILLASRTSLILTSADLDWMQRARVEAAIEILRGRGFDEEAFLLTHVAHYRASDNWWNRYIGHQAAYAATNFPFEVVTLYPRFFKVAVDDTERAVVLLHEAQHLLGRGEDAALVYVWGVRQRVGWTKNRYGTTRVWRDTEEWTAQSAPALVACASTVPCGSLPR